MLGFLFLSRGEIGTIVRGFHQFVVLGASRLKGSEDAPVAIATDFQGIRCLVQYGLLR